MNTVLILTDTQPTRMVGAYGNEWADTPNLDRLARTGVRFDRAYTPCPLCTAARGAIFTGRMPATNGAWANETSPGRAVPLMGEVLRDRGLRAGYTGKWHLDGGGYHGTGKPDGGFEPEEWFDGVRYLREVGEERHRAFCRAISGGIAPEGGMNAEKARQMAAHDPAAALRDAGCREEFVWGHGVADRAIRFLERVGDDSFVLVVSPDEPHGPFITPPEYQELFKGDIPPPENFAASLEGKPSLQKRQAEEFPVSAWEHYIEWRRRHFRCNAYIDREIGRVIDAVERLHGDDTVVIATSDHGDMMGSHGLLSKGAMMYDECTRVPLLARMPGGASGAVCDTPVSLLDLFPTVLDAAGQRIPADHQGVSLVPLLRDPGAEMGRDAVSIQFNRFGLFHDGYGAFYPIRCRVDGRYKLAINLLDDRDELYDLKEDPLELHNRIDDASLAGERDRLHDGLLADMDRTIDPLRGPCWAIRPWRRKEPAAWFHGLPTRKPPGG